MSGKNKPQGSEYSVELNTPGYFLYCGIGGIVSCGSTHTMITPLDLCKCRMQVDPAKYKGIFSGFKVLLSEGGPINLVRGWLPTLLGYSAQGFFKFGGYEFFKYTYSSMVSPRTAYDNRTGIFLVSAATAELIADVALCPFEAVKVKIQTTPGYTTSMLKGMSQMSEKDGVGIFYRGLVPLWGRQIPYTMMKFTSFEATLEYLYAKVVPKPRDQCSKGEQLLVTFAAGYIAGVLCAIVSHPADTIVSKLNKDPTTSMGKIINEVGFIGIWKGLVARIIMIGTLTGAQWFVYDAFKVFMNMPRPPPPVKPY